MIKKSVYKGIPYQIEISNTHNRLLTQNPPQKSTIDHSLKFFENVFDSNASSTGSSIKPFGVLKRPRTVENENGQGIDHSPMKTRVGAGKSKLLFFLFFWSSVPMIWDELRNK